MLFTDGPGRDDVVLEPYDSDQSAAFGGTLEWSLKVFDGDTTRWNSVPVATIKGANGVNLTYRASDAETPGSDWTNYAVSLSDQGGWYVGGGNTPSAPIGTPATNDQIKAVLANVSSVEVRPALYSNAPDWETVGVDSFAIRTPT